jgi:hypothetical protein
MLAETHILGLSGITKIMIENGPTIIVGPRAKANTCVSWLKGEKLAFKGEKVC